MKKRILAAVSMSAILLTSCSKLPIPWIKNGGSNNDNAAESARAAVEGFMGSVESGDIEAAKGYLATPDILKSIEQYFDMDRLGSIGDIADYMPEETVTAVKNLILESVSGLIDYKIDSASLTGADEAEVNVTLTIPDLESINISEDAINRAIGEVFGIDMENDPEQLVKKLFSNLSFSDLIAMFANRDQKNIIKEFINSYGEEFKQVIDKVVKEQLDNIGTKPVPVKFTVHRQSDGQWKITAIEPK